MQAAALVHRDLKPSNVLLALDGPRLIDFGAARAGDAATTGPARSVTASTPQSWRRCTGRVTALAQLQALQL